MSRGYLFAALALLLAAGLAAVLIEGAGQDRALRTLPSSTNGDPRGLLAAFRYLEARGLTVERLEGPAPRSPQVLVMPGVAGRALRPEEVERVLEGVAAGGLLVLMAPTSGSLEDSQPALAAALGLRKVRRRGEVRVETPPERDPSERLRAVYPDPLLGGGSWFLADVDAGIEIEDGLVLAEAGETPVIVRRELGAGLVYAFSTPTLLENHRLGLADNLMLLEGLARTARAAGLPVRFDELHHLPPARGDAGSILGSPGVLGSGVQLLLLGALVLLAAGRRFGPVRPLVTDRRRSSLEYVDTLAALYRRAGDEGALCAEVGRDLRRRLFERHGISTALEDREAAERLAGSTGLSAESILETFAIVRRRPPDLRAAVTAVATLEARLGDAFSAKEEPWQQAPR